jgi:hypothetical protein
MGRPDYEAAGLRCILTRIDWKETVMRQLSLLAFLCLAAGLASADFEIADPAAGYEKRTISVDAEDAGDFAVEGAGVKSCEEYLSDKKKNAAMNYINLNWAKGFVSGVNYVRMEEKKDSQLGAGLDLDALTLYLDNYCQAHPEGKLSDATISLVDELRN